MPDIRRPPESSLRRCLKPSDSQKPSHSHCTGCSGSSPPDPPPTSPTHLSSITSSIARSPACAARMPAAVRSLAVCMDTERRPRPEYSSTRWRRWGREGSGGGEGTRPRSLHSSAGESREVTDMKPLQNPEEELAGRVQESISFCPPRPKSLPPGSSSSARHLRVGFNCSGCVPAGSGARHAGQRHSASGRPMLNSSVRQPRQAEWPHSRVAGRAARSRHRQQVSSSLTRARISSGRALRCGNPRCRSQWNGAEAVVISRHQPLWRRPGRSGGAGANRRGRSHLRALTAGFTGSSQACR